MRKLIFISLIVSLISNEVFSQSNLLNAKNPSEIGVSSSMDKINPTFLEYPEIDEKDILWSKVVYEYIDLNEKLNFPLLFPVNDEQYTETRKSLWKIIRENIENETIDEVENAHARRVHQGLLASKRQSRIYTKWFPRTHHFPQISHYI